MKLPWIIATTAMAILLPRPVAGGRASADSAAAQSIRISPPALELRTPDRYFLRGGLDETRTGYLNLSLSMSALSWYQPPTRFDAVLNGAGSAGTVGMFIGAIGNTLGWFDEETTWWLAGSLATVGAVYAGTRYEPQPGLRLRWSPSSDGTR